MSETEGKCSVALVAGAMLVLAINYEFLSADVLGFRIGSISIASVKTNGLLLPVSAIAVLVGCGICHVRHIWPILFESYTHSYKESPGIIELVQSEVAAASQDSKYGSPYGGLRGSFWPSEQSLGRFIRPDGVLSHNVVIKLKGSVHRQAVLCGLRSMFEPKFWLGSYGPLVIGLWALLSITV